MMETTDSGDAEKYWRADGKIDEGAAKDTWTVDCLGGGATKKALDSLLAHGVVEGWNNRVRSTSNF